MQTSTHDLTIGARKVRKEFVGGHEAQAEREWACLTLIAEHAPGLAPRPLRRADGERPVVVMSRLGSRLPGVYDVDALPAAVGLDAEDRARMEAYRPLMAAFRLAMLLPGNGGWRRNPRGTTEAQAAHFMALAGHH